MAIATYRLMLDINKDGEKNWKTKANAEINPNLDWLHPDSSMAPLLPRPGSPWLSPIPLLLPMVDRMTRLPPCFSMVVL